VRTEAELATMNKKRAGAWAVAKLRPIEQSETYVIVTDTFGSPSLPASWAAAVAFIRKSKLI
jgi:hypothetical protein